MEPHDEDQTRSAADWLTRRDAEVVPLWPTGLSARLGSGQDRQPTSGKA
jgi:hypothetical protein